MKKVFTLLVAVMITAVTFAQVAPRVIYDKTPVQISKENAKVMSVSQKNAANADFWFNFAEALESYWGMDLDGFGPPIMCDTVGLYYYNDTTITPVQFMSFGQVYDFNHACWNEFYDIPDYEEYVIPHLGQTSQYSIDSIELCLQYHWGENVAEDVVDTLRISYVVGLDNEDVYIHSPSNPRFAMVKIPYDNQLYAAATSIENPYDGSTIALSSSSAVVYVDDILLTYEDVTDSSYFYYFRLPVPEELQNITSKRIAVSATFVPGVERTPTSYITQDINSFRTILYDDPREEWNTYGSDELLSDVQCGTFTDDWNFYNSSWYGLLQPNNFWQGNPKPFIGLHATCSDCAVVNVPEVENTVVNIYPNPATSVLNVVTNTNEKMNVEMFNILGQKVYSEQVVNNTKINVSNMKAGVYMLKVNNHTTKVVIK